MQDYEMIKRIQQGDKALFGQLAEKYYDEVFRYCYYKTGSEHTACDCTQETFLHVLRFLENYSERKRFKAWLFRIALNVCRDHYRQSSNAPLSYEDSKDCSLREQNMDLSGSPQERVENRIMVQRGLLSLPEYQQEVIILYFYHGYKLREIASITGVPLSTAKSRLKQGMDKLRVFFIREGITGENLMKQEAETRRR